MATSWTCHALFSKKSHFFTNCGRGKSLITPHPSPSGIIMSIIRAFKWGIICFFTIIGSHCNSTSGYFHNKWHGYYRSKWRNLCPCILKQSVLFTHSCCRLSDYILPLCQILAFVMMPCSRGLKVADKRIYFLCVFLNTLTLLSSNWILKLCPGTSNSMDKTFVSSIILNHKISCFMN